MAGGPTFKQVVRAMERAHRQSVRAAEKARREAERAHKAQLRESEKRRREAEKQAKADYLLSRQAEVEDLNADLESTVAMLGTPLFGLEPGGPVDLGALRKVFVPNEFDAGVIGKRPAPPDPASFESRVEKPSVLKRIFGSTAEYEARLASTRKADRQRFEAAANEHEGKAAAWDRALASARAEFEKAEARRKAEIDEHNLLIDEMEESFLNVDPEVVAEYFSMVLERPDLPEGIPVEYRLAYVPESRQLVVEREVPGAEIVPAVREYSYVKTKDEIREKARTKTDTRALHEAAVANTVLLTVADVFSADTARAVETLVVNGVADTISPATGERVRPCLVSLRLTRQDFDKLVLDRVDPVVCVSGLGSVSKRMGELTPVRPVLEFDTVDRRFTEHSDVLSGLDSRPNIMDLDPFEFEHLVTNLFAGMGLEAKLTRSSRDGGVDCVAFDPRPVLGGKVVIQAKRYRRTVGVAAVRDLYGTMINEGASKGLLVTTAGYGPDAFTFAKDKPIELIDGSGLLYLLGEQGVEAKIVMPQDDLPH